MNNRGMTLVETAVAVGILMLVSGALVSMAVGAMSVANASRMRAQATRLAEQRMEFVKQKEQQFKTNIQTGDWGNAAGFISNITCANCPTYSEPASPNFSFANSAGGNFFTRTTTLNPPLPGSVCSGTTCTVEVTVRWTYRGMAPNCTAGSERNCVRLTTTVTRWL